MLDSDVSSEDELIDDQTTMNVLNNGKNPFIKLMILGRINQRVQDVLNKKKLNQIDVKLLKGLFTRQRNEEPPKKGINDTFRPMKTTEQTGPRSTIIRKFKSFVLRESVDELNKSRERISVLESIEEFLD
jgi:hypothetical protein